jgi:transposase
MKPYSLDIRQKIVDVYQAGGISQRQVAINFNVALSFVSKIILNHKRYNTIQPRERLLQTPSKLNDENLEILRQIVLDNPDATLKEYRQILLDKTGVSLSISSIDRIIRTKLGFTSKKKASSPAKRKPREFKKPASSIGS